MTIHAVCALDFEALPTGFALGGSPRRFIRSFRADFEAPSRELPWGEPTASSCHTNSLLGSALAVPRRLGPPLRSLPSLPLPPPSGSFLFPATRRSPLPVPSASLN